MKFIDLETPYLQSKDEINAAIQRVLTHGQYIGGPEIAELEGKLAARAGVRHCIVMNSGTCALQVALMALNIGPGDEVITTPFSFFAIAEAILLVGAKAVFVDIDSRTYNLDPQLLEKAITQNTKAIIPVSLFGQCADFDAINAIAERHNNIPVIEDGAQSFGALYKGRPSCGLSTLATTSFFPSKPLGCYGEGGACFTNDDQLAHLMRSIINHGQEGRYEHVRVGFNGRLASIQAAVLLVKLESFTKEIELRQSVAAYYQEQLKEAVITPYIEDYNLSVYAQYTIQVEQRDSVQEKLKTAGIPTAVHYPKPLHKQPIFKETAYYSLSFPESELAAARVLSLPFYPSMSPENVKRVCDCL